MTMQKNNEQSWFWAKEWQDGEKEAEEQLKNGKASKKMDSAEMMTHLDGLMKNSNDGEQEK
jgi:hypothetical protein